MGKKFIDAIEWNYDLRSLIEEKNKKVIQKIMKDRVSWVNNKYNYRYCLPIHH